MSITTKPASAGRQAISAAVSGEGYRPGRRPGVLAIVTVVMLVVFAWAAFLYAPEDLAQGPMQRIFYIHLPSAWVCFLAYGVTFCASIYYLARRDMRADALAAASAQVGTLCTTVVLATGMLWGHAIWGVYWTWEPRLTSFLVLWLMYLGYLAVRAYVPDPSRRARFSAVLGIVAAIDIPIIYLSVNWWRTLHPQQVIITKGGPQMPPGMIVALMIGLATFSLVYLYLTRLSLQVNALHTKLEEIED